MLKNGLTFMDFAYQVLSETRIAMTPDEIWESEPGEKLKSMIKTSGKTPLATMGAQLYVDVKKGNSRFAPVGSRPVRFTIKGMPLSESPSEPQINPTDNKKKSFLEKELHPHSGLVCPSGIFRVVQNHSAYQIHQAKRKTKPMATSGYRWFYFIVKRLVASGSRPVAEDWGISSKTVFI